MLYKMLHVRHFLKLLDKMYKYEMDSTRTVGATERTRDAGWMDGRMDGRMEGNQYTPQQLHCIMMLLYKTGPIQSTFSQQWWPGAPLTWS